MAENTPTTEQIETAWVARFDGEHNSAAGREADGYREEFNLWLNEVKREAWKEGAYWHSTLSGDYEKYYRGYKGNPYVHGEEK